MSTLTTSVNAVLEFLARAISQEKEIQGIGKKEIRLFSDDMILTIKEPKEFTKKLFELINKLRNVAGYKINTSDQLYFYTLVVNCLKINLRKQSKGFPSGSSG